MDKRGGIYLVSRRILLSIVFAFVLFVFQFYALLYSEGGKVDIAKFLEDIRRTIQKITQQQERLKIKDKDKNREMAKSKARKKIVGKLSNPVVRIMQGHHIINYEKQVVSENSKVNNSSAVSSAGNTGRTSSFSETSLINKKLKDALMPLKVPSLNEILQRTKSNNNMRAQENNNLDSSLSQTPGGVDTIDLRRWTRDVINWLLEATKGVRMFWFLVYSHFQHNPEGYKYLQKQECKEEIDTSHPYFMSVINISDMTLFSSISNIIPLYGYASRYVINKNINSSSPDLPVQNEEKSLCYNLAVLNKYGYESKKLGFDIAMCLKCYEDAFLQSASPTTDSSERKKLIKCIDQKNLFTGCKDPTVVTKKLKEFKRAMAAYYKRMEWVFKKKLLFTLAKSKVKYVDNYNSGASSSMSVLLFQLYSPIISLTKNSFKSLHKKLSSIDGDLYIYDRSCKLGKEFLDSVKTVVDEKFPAYLEQLQKVDEENINEVGKLFAMVAQMQEVAAEIKKLVVQQAGNQLTDCALDKLSIWNAILANEPQDNILSVTDTFSNTDLEKYLKEKIGSSPSELQKILEELSEKIQKLGKEKLLEASPAEISSVEQYITKIYETLLYLVVLYNIIVEKGACSNIGSILKRFGLEDKEELIACLFQDKELTKCFGNEQLQKEFNKIALSDPQNGVVQVIQGESTNKKCSRFSIAGLVQFIYQELFQYDTLTKQQGYCINFTQSCVNITIPVDEELQLVCDQLNGTGYEWKEVCSKLVKRFGSIENFKTNAPQCLNCLQKEKGKCSYTYKANCSSPTQCTAREIKQIIKGLLEGGCRMRKGENEETIGEADRKVINTASQCCRNQMETAELAKLLQEKCNIVAQKLPPELKVEEMKKDVCLKTTAMKIEIRKILLGKFKYILGEQRFNKYEIPTNLEKGKLSLDLSSCR